MSEGRPITPDEVAVPIPPEVIDVFNALIRKFWDGKEALIRQDDVVEAILLQFPRYTRQGIFNNHWLNVESLYEKAGWAVSYLKPAYNEHFRAYYTFRKPS